MSLKSALTAVLLADVTTRVLQTLRSISHTIPAAELTQLVEDKIAALGPCVARPGNDLGMMVSELTVAAEEQYRQGGSELDAARAALAASPLHDQLLDQFSYGLADVMATQLRLLRDKDGVPGASDRLVAAIDAEAPAQLAKLTAGPEAKIVTWGRLNDPTYRMVVMMNGQETANLFHKDRFEAGYTTAALHRMHAQRIADLSPEQLACEALAAVPAELRAYVGDRLKRDQLDGSLAHALESGAGMAALPGLVETLGELSLAVEEALRREALPEPVRRNLEATQQATLLGHAAVLNFLQVRGKDALILAGSTEATALVNGFALEAFTAKGGALSDASNHLLLATLRKIPTPDRGFALEEVLAYRDAAAAATERHRETLAAQAHLADRRALQLAVGEALDAWHASRQLEGEMKLGELHRQLRDAAVVSADRQKPLSQLATDYLVAMHNNPLLSQLYHGIAKNVTALVASKAEASPAALNRCFCTAVTDVVVGFFAEQAIERL